MPVFDFDLFILLDPHDPHALKVSTGPVLGVGGVVCQCVCVCAFVCVEMMSALQL